MAFVRPLNQQAIRQADDDFYRNHPELVINGVRIAIDPTDPEQQSLRNEWISSYIKNGGQETGNGLRKIEEKEEELEEETPGDNNAVPKPAPKPAEKPPESVVEPCPSPEEKIDPTIKVKWSKTVVTPIHNETWPPATPPTDAIPEDSKVRMIIETTDVPDGSKATIEIYHCLTGALVKNGTIKKLVVTSNGVYDEASGKLPEWSFEYDHVLWDPYDKPYYYFKGTVEYAGLIAETPKDFESNEAETLRVEYLHVCVSDLIADSSPPFLTTVAEMNEIGKILKGKSLHHFIYKQKFNAKKFNVNIWGSVLRNCYSYHHASHGSLVDRTSGRHIQTNSNPPTRPVGNWRSVIVLGKISLGDGEIANAGDVPSSPKYLMYLNTCVAGWEPSFANSILARGTMHVIAFRKFIPDDAARSMARKFHKEWRTINNCNPAKIPDIFAKYKPRFHGSMRPVLFSAPAPAPPPAEAALAAIEENIITI